MTDHLVKKAMATKPIGLEPIFAMSPLAIKDVLRK